MKLRVLVADGQWFQQQRAQRVGNCFNTSALHLHQASAGFNGCKSSCTTKRTDAQSKPSSSSETQASKTFENVASSNLSLSTATTLAHKDLHRHRDRVKIAGGIARDDTASFSHGTEDLLPIRKLPDLKTIQITQNHCNRLLC
jgi:hypothetical protein